MQVKRWLTFKGKKIPQTPTAAQKINCIAKHLIHLL